MSAHVRREVMCIIDCYFKEALPGKSPLEKTKCFVSRSFFSLDEIPKIKICHMLVKEHSEVIEGRRRLIDMDVLGSEEADEDDSIVHYYNALDEEDGSGLVGAGVKEEVGDM